MSKTGIELPEPLIHKSIIIKELKGEVTKPILKKEFITKLIKSKRVKDYYPGLLTTQYK